jgi:hypothetical protein
MKKRMMRTKKWKVLLNWHSEHRTSLESNHLFKKKKNTLKKKKKLNLKLTNTAVPITWHQNQIGCTSSADSNDRCIRVSYPLVCADTTTRRLIHEPRKKWIGI